MYGLSESMNEDNKGLCYGVRDAIHVLSHSVTMHQAPGASCGLLYILVLSLVQYPF